MSLFSTKSDAKWQRDDEVTRCNICNVQFKGNLFKSGKHHCRMCLRIICADCSKYELEKKRICYDCNLKLSQKKSYKESKKIYPLHSKSDEKKVNSDDKSISDLDYEEELNECIVNPNGNDRRRGIWESPNKNDGIVQCMGTLETQYMPDEKLKDIEKTHGTGTVIHIDKDDCIYVLTAAHNIAAMQRECVKCKNKTLKKRCSDTNCTGDTIQLNILVEPTDIYFTRRAADINNLGQAVETYQAEKYHIHYKYKQDPNCRSARGGYDIAIIIFKCHDNKGINLYRQNCKNIQLGSENVEGRDCAKFVYGFPMDKAIAQNYPLFGHGTSKINTSNKFRFRSELNNKTDEYYIVNTAIDTSSGQSGSVIYSYNNNNRHKFKVYGVHTGGSEKKRENYGTGFNGSVIEWIWNVSRLKVQWLCTSRVMLITSVERKKDRELVIKYMTNDNLIQVNDEDIITFGKGNDDMCKEQLMNSIQEMFDDKQFSHVIYYSGPSEKHTGNWEFRSNSNQFHISLDDIVSLWRMRKNPIELQLNDSHTFIDNLVIVSDCNYSGQWVEDWKNKFADHSKICIQASCGENEECDAGVFTAVWAPISIAKREHKWSAGKWIYKSAAFVPKSLFMTYGAMLLYDLPKMAYNATYSFQPCKTPNATMVHLIAISSKWAVFICTVSRWRECDRLKTVLMAKINLE